MSPNWLRHPLQPATQRHTLALEPFLRGPISVAERGPARLEAHRRSKEGCVSLPGLDQVKLGPRVLDPQCRQTELQEVLAVDAPSLLHDRVETAIAQGDDAAVGARHQR